VHKAAPALPASHALRASKAAIRVQSVSRAHHARPAATAKTSAQLHQARVTYAAQAHSVRHLEQHPATNVLRAPMHQTQALHPTPRVFHALQEHTAPHPARSTKRSV